MDRSTPNRRLERVERSSPYSRPNQSKIKKSTSLASFSTVRSLISYALTPFRQSPTLPQHTSDIKMDEVASEDGSEDDWDGEPPKLMQGQDVFDLAAAGGREGKEFEARTEAYRSKGEVPGGKREVARRQLQLGITSMSAPEPNGFPVTGGYTPIRPSPSMPVLPVASSNSSSSVTRSHMTPFAGSSTSLASNKRARSPPVMSTPLPARSPIPTSWQTSLQPSTSLASTLTTSTSGGNTTSASSAALAAFLKGKEGHSMTEEDFKVIDTLTHNMRSETLPSSPIKIGGWSASASRPVRALPSSTFAPSTPAATPTRPGQTFSIGATPPRASPGPLNPNRHQVTYLGPGMSPKRLLGKPRSSLGLKPLLDISTPITDSGLEESAKKRRKTDLGEGALQVEVSTTITTPPTPELLNGSPSVREKGKGRADNGPIAPSPLNQSFTPASPTTSGAKSDAVKIGKQRAADIMKSLIEQDIQNIESPADSSTAKEREQSFVIFNPYDNGDREKIVSATSPSTPRAGSRTPAKSILRSAVGTPLRGAAARLEASKKSMSGKQMSTLEKLGVKTNKKAQVKVDGQDTAQDTPSASSKHVRSETPTQERDMSEVEPLFIQSKSTTPSTTPAPEFTPAASNAAGPSSTRQISPRKVSGTSPRQPSPLRHSFTLQDDEIPIKPFEIPTFTSASQVPLPINTSSSTSRFEYNSPSQDATLASVASKVDKPVFKPSAPTSASHSQIDEEPKLNITRKTSTPSSKPFDPTEIYLSAKDSALKVDQAALPFYTFNLTQSAITEKKGSESAKAAALIATLREYTFHLPLPASSMVSKGEEWTCSLCACKNPDSVKLQCTVCEEPRPVKASNTTSNSSTGADWTCTMCMLTNPASATEECTICKEKRQAVAAVGGVVKHVPFKWPARDDGKESKVTTGAGNGEWTCSMCMLKNGGTATVKCEFCEEPRK